MTPQKRLKLAEIGVLGEFGIPELEGVTITGKELADFLDPYVATYPDREGWPQLNNHQTNHLLFPLLCHQTNNHCSFCDGYPMADAMSAETIEHFRPKSGLHARPDLRLTWTNLYACCSGCQGAKGSQWKPDLLAPDAEDYSFKRYFSCNFTTGEIVPRPRANAADKLAAQNTIDLYNLNRYAGYRREMFTAHPYYGTGVGAAKKPFRYWQVEIARVKRDSPLEA